MCAACGILGGGSDWLDRGGESDGIGLPPGFTWLAERQRRLALVNRLLAPSRIRLSEHGRQLVVRGATGRTKIVADLAHVWVAADLLGGSVDLLDEGYLASLEPVERGVDHG